MSWDARRSLIAPSSFSEQLKMPNCGWGGFDPKSAVWGVSSGSQKPQHLASYL